MMKAFLLILSCTFLLSACSTYKTNLKDVSFSDTRYTDKPIIPVEPNVKIDNKQMNFLGWVDVYVKRPRASKPVPTKEQVNYVLAYQAKQRGANAVLNVSYKSQFSFLGQTRLTGRGQAVRIAPDAYAKLIRELHYYQMPKTTIDGIEYRSEADANPLIMQNTAPAPSIAVAAKQPSAKTSNASQPAETASASEDEGYLYIPTQGNAAPAAANQNQQIIVEQIEGLCQALVLLNKNNGVINKEEWKNRTKMMLNNLLYLTDSLKDNKNPAIQSALSRLTQLLKQQQTDLQP